MTKKELILKNVLDECTTHNSRMNSAYMKIAHQLPFDENNIKNFTDEDIAYIDQYIYRFTKLQDAIGSKLFRAVLSELGEDSENKPIIDIINRLEKLGIINTYDNWKEMRDLRNEAAHDYGNEPAETAATLNLLFNKKTSLEAYLKDIIYYLADRSK